MRKKITLIALFLGLAALLVGAYLIYKQFGGELDLPEVAGPTDILEAPDFHAETQAGAPVSLSDFFGRPTIVYFWTSWCTWCTRGMEELERFHTEADDIQILAVNLPHLGGSPDELARGRAFMEEHGFAFVSLYDVHGEAQSAYDITGVPMALFIDSDGTLVHSQLGFLDMDGLAHFAAMLS